MRPPCIFICGVSLGAQRNLICALCAHWPEGMRKAAQQTVDLYTIYNSKWLCRTLRDASSQSPTHNTHKKPFKQNQPISREHDDDDDATICSLFASI